MSSTLIVDVSMLVDISSVWESYFVWIQACAFDTIIESDTQRHASLALRMNRADGLGSMVRNRLPLIVTIIEPEDDLDESV